VQIRPGGSEREGFSIHECFWWAFIDGFAVARPATNFTAVALRTAEAVDA
jgi:hypothetical protein